MSANLDQRRRAAERQRLHRKRRGEGKIVLRIPFNHVEIAEALIAEGLLKPEDYDDIAAIERAVERAHLRIIGAAE